MATRRTSITFTPASPALRLMAVAFPDPLAPVNKRGMLNDMYGIGREAELVERCALRNESSRVSIAFEKSGGSSSTESSKKRRSVMDDLTFCF